jgi:hypothetical protein
MFRRLVGHGKVLGGPSKPSIYLLFVPQVVILNAASFSIVLLPDPDWIIHRGAAGFGKWQAALDDACNTMQPSWSASGPNPRATQLPAKTKPQAYPLP